MTRRRFSVATIVAATLVTITTLLLGAFGVWKYRADRAEKWGRLHRVNDAVANVLAVSLALPIWNIDRAQIDKIVESMSATPTVHAVVVTAAGKTHAHVRTGPWLMPTDRPFPTAGLLVEERPIVFNNQRIGTVRLYATPKFIIAELRQSLLTMVGMFLLFEVMLVVSVYFVLWRTVLRPLVAVQEYATAVSEGRAAAETTKRAAFPAELDALRSSIETMVAALQEGETRFRTIFDSANDAIFLTDPETGRIADVNSRIADMYGYSREEALKLEIAQLSSGVEPYTQEGALAVMGKVLTGESQVFEWHARHRDGHLFWVEGSTRLATIEGRPRMIVVVRDITQRKEMESALKAEKDFTDAAINSIMGVFFVRDAAGRLIRWNQGMEVVRGVSGDALMNETDLLAIHADDRSRVKEKIAEVFERGYAETEARVLVGPEVRHYLFNGRRMDRGGEAFMVGTGIDITDRKRVEAEREILRVAIEESAVEWRQTFDSVRTPIIITDENGVVRRLNDAAAELAERVRSEIPGTPIAALGDGPWRSAAELIPSFDGIHAAAEARDGFGRTWDVHLGRLYSPGSDNSLIVVFWEITGIVALQDSLRRSERMSAMGALVAGVAHEVRNPLFGMSALLDAYAGEMSDPELEQFATGLRQQVTRLTHLMRELLEFGKPVAISLFPEALSEVVEEAVVGRAHAASEAKIVLRNAVDPLLPAVPMDRGRLRQVFENLIDNALQHAPAVRTVTISARQHSGTSIECTVEDDGPGFQPDDLPHVFEPFFTRRERGTGLGLSIVHRIVEEHSGRVSAANRAGGGAVITMHFPAERPSSAASRHLLPLAQEKAN